LLVALAVLGWPTVVMAQRVVSELRPSQPVLGQDVRFYVQVRAATAATCDLDPVEGLEIQLEDHGVSNQSTRITIINGRRQVVETSDYTFVYRLVPARAGRFELRPPRVRVGNEQFEGAPTVFFVTDSSKDDRAILEMRAEPERLVLGQDGKIIVDVLLKVPPTDLGSEDPLELYDQARSFSLFDQGTPPPVLSLPWITDPPQGLGKIDLNQWVQARQARRGFQIAQVRGARFLEPGSSATETRTNADGESVRYRRYRFALEVRGEVVGSYDFAAAGLEGQFVTRQGQRYVWSDGFMRSAPLRIEVMEPPMEGRPASFQGAIGRFAFEMPPPTPTQVTVGNAVFLTLVAKGRGFLKGVDFDLQRQLGSDFRVDRVGVTDSLPPGSARPAGFPDRPGDWRQWDFKVYPQSPAVREIPPLEFSSFDAESRGYLTATTAAVPLTVTPPKAGGDGVLVANAEGGGGRAIELVRTAAISANVTDLNLLGDQRFRVLPYVLIGIGMALVFGLTRFFVNRRRRLGADPILLRRLRAAPRFLTRLDSVRTLTGGEALRTAHDALRGYVADLTGRQEEAITATELIRWCEDNVADAGLRERIRALGEQVEALRYGGVVGAVDLQALSGLEKITRAVAKAKGASSATFLLCCAALVAGARAQDVDTFQAAQQAFDRGEYRQAAERWAQMADGDYENGHVRYNEGNAWLRAGEVGRAIAAYRRAALFLPRDANVEVNLRRALELRGEPGGDESRAGGIAALLFWRDHSSASEQGLLALIAMSTAFAVAMARLFVGRRSASLAAVQWCAVVVALVLLTTAYLAGERLAARSSAVVVAPAVPLRTGPGENFELRFEQALKEGAELRVLTVRDGWLEVRVGEEYVGWLPAAAVERW
jgi:tetratricopeptide (TPR) repeat protein